MPPVQHKKNRVSRRVLRTRSRLLDAAQALFREKGVEATAIEEITERADVGKGTFYRYFRNKDAAVLALAESAVNPLIERLESGAPARRDVEGALEYLLKTHAAFFAERQEEFHQVFAGRMLMRLQKGGAATLDGAYGRYLAILRDVLESCGARAEEGRLRRFVCALAEFVSGVAALKLIGLSPEEIETIVAPVHRAFVARAGAYLAACPPVSDDGRS